ncbi:uncharacterized protein TNCV_2950501 [Trichonephila clavipes]|nr:uncharacterized protein TNCV_2950501 [Trichonephila clavipes]
MDATKVNIPSNIDLADKDFGIPGEIDMLIGCEFFFELLRPNKFRSPCEKWLFQETIFGYIVVGSFDKFEEKSYCGLAINAEINSDNLNQQFQAFWEIEKEKGRIIIHGFADASTAAYGAVLYAQSISEEDVSTRLLCSKSRVAPVKPITIPRLELCACVLLSQLLEKVLHSLTLPIQQIMLWTDSNIVLAWIQRSPKQLKTFIGNRIKIIQRLTQNFQWNHVSSNENPADLISRGLNASDISSKQLWWHGSDFLREELEANPIDFERITSESDYIKELKPANVLLTSCKFTLIDDLSKRSNNYTKLLHILSYIFRFLHNSRNPSVKRSGQLDYSEVNEAELCLIKNLQASAFQEEIEFLAKSSCNSKKGKLFSLNPFLDRNQILRVGGRLQNSDLTYRQKHPAILPADHLLTKLIMINTHNRNFHLGPQALLYCTRQRFWPLRGRSIARKIVHECVEFASKINLL